MIVNFKCSWQASEQPVKMWTAEEIDERYPWPKNSQPSPAKDVDVVGRNEFPESEVVTFKTTDGEFRMFHQQSCCEGVSLYDITGDGEWLLGTPVLKAEESTNSSDPPEDKTVDSFTWTFYRISTIHGTVTLRWLGESNGYYGEEVEFEKVTA